MDIEKRVENLEKNFIKLLNKLDNNKFYTDADISGVRQNVSEVNQKLDESVYPDWDPKSYPYFAGERVSYNDEYYRCIQNHTSQADWAPDVAVSLWVKIPNPSEEWPEWVQPTGAQDAYMTGDRVSHNDKHWICTMDYCVYEPGVYGWDEA